MDNVMNKAKVVAFLNKFGHSVASEVEAGSTGEGLNEWLDPVVGLCSNLSSFMMREGLGYVCRGNVRTEFNKQIEKARTFSDLQYPFNPGVAGYLNECESGTLYINPHRLAFIEILKGLKESD